jgi:hypothetical protein
MFESVEQAQDLATKWLYNNDLPNTVVGGMPPPAAVLKVA